MHPFQAIHRRYLYLGATSAPLGMLLGIYMAASGNHVLAPVHAHLLLIGWIGFFVQGLYYRIFAKPRGSAEIWQFRLGFAGLVVMVPALSALLLGWAYAEIGTAIAAILLLASAVLFLGIVLRDGIREELASSTTEPRG